MITVDEFISYLSINTPERIPVQVISFMKQCILASVDEINRFTNRRLAVLDPVTLELQMNTRTEYYDGNGSADLFLDTFPVVFIEDTRASLMVLKQDNTGWENLLRDADTMSSTVLILDNGRIKLLNNYIFPQGVKNIRIKYNAGYTSETLPAELKIICYEKSQEKFRNGNFEEKSRLGIERLKTDAGEWLFRQKEHEKILLYYRRKVI